MRNLFFIIAIILSHTEISAQCSNMCYTLKISGIAPVIKLDTIDKVLVNYRITNCGIKPVKIDTTEYLGYDLEYDGIFFQVYTWNEKGIYQYPIQAIDMQRMYGKSDHVLNPHGSFEYRFNVFKFYKILEPGKYRVKAFYRCYLGESCEGYYMQDSNYFDFSVIN